MKCLRRALLLLLPLAVILTAWALALEAPRLRGARGIVIDYDTGEVCFAKDADTPQPAASMTKVMTTYLLCEDIKAGKLTWDTPIPVSRYAADMSRTPDYSGMEKLTAGRSYPARTLANLSLISSCCGSSTVIGEYVGGGTEAGCVERMNAKAAEWGIDAAFADASGFEDEGNAVTPRAMAAIAQKIIRLDPTVLDITSTKSYSFNGKTFRTTNSMLRSGTYPGIDGLKSGYTYGSLWCFTGTAQRNGRRVISVTMGCPTAAAAVADTRALLDYGFAYLDTVVAPREAAKDAAWAAMTAHVSHAGVPAPFTTGAFSFAVDAAGDLGNCAAAWTLDGVPVPGHDAVPFSITKGAALAAQLPIGAHSGAVRVGLRLTDDRGRSRLFEEVVTLAPDVRTALFAPSRATALPDGTVKLAVTYLSDNAEAQVPYTWYLDDKPLPGWSGRMGASAARVVTFPAGVIPPGDHLLRLAVAPGGLPGANPSSVSARVSVPAAKAA